MQANTLNGPAYVYLSSARKPRTSERLRIGCTQSTITPLGSHMRIVGAGRLDALLIERYVRLSHRRRFLGAEDSIPRTRMSMPSFM